MQRGSWNSSAARMKMRSTEGWEMVSKGVVVLWGMENLRATWETVWEEMSQIERMV